MSKNLLGSARKIRAGLQPALIREAQRQDNKAKYQRLMFLDQTLERMIKRFEDEYPETRLPPTKAVAPTPMPDHASPTETSIIAGGTPDNSSYGDPRLSDDEGGLRPALSRHNSDVSLASRALSQEEGRMHRFGQKMRREILKPEMEDHKHSAADMKQWAPHLQLLRDTLEELGGEEIRKKIEAGGQNALIQELNIEASALRQSVIESDPEGWRQFQQAQEAMLRNSHLQGMDPHASAIE